MTLFWAYVSQRIIKVGRIPLYAISHVVFCVLDLIRNHIDHYALSREMTQGSHGTCAWTLRPCDRYMMYTDIYCKYTLTYLLHFILL